MKGRNDGALSQLGMLVEEKRPSVPQRRREQQQQPVTVSPAGGQADAVEPLRGAKMQPEPGKKQLKLGWSSGSSSAILCLRSRVIADRASVNGLEAAFVESRKQPVGVAFHPVPGCVSLRATCASCWHQENKAYVDC